MPLAHKLKEAPQPTAIIALLNQLLANTIDFKLSAKQAHWNVRGANFIALHELFDKVSSTADEYVDLVAERVAQLNGTAQGSLQVVAEQSVLPPYPSDIHEAQDHVRALSNSIGLLADAHRHAINTSINAGDMITADMLTETARGLDKLHWFIRSHLNG